MAACYSQMGCYLSRYERERRERMIISRTATIRIRKNKEKVNIFCLLRPCPFLVLIFCNFHNNLQYNKR